MKYYVVDFIISCKKEIKNMAKELLADAAGEAGFESFEDTKRGMKGYVQTDMLDHNMLEELIQNFILPDVNISYTLSPMEDRNWNEEWEKQGFDPIVIGNDIVIYDAKHDRLTDDDKITIGIDTKQAFGTGTHETTRMIISVLLTIDIKEKRILDCGCGTGILGIAALKLGAAQAVGYDIDEWSVNNSKHNAQINRIDNMQILHGNVHVLTHVNGIFDIVLANINRNILLADLPAFKEVLSKQGTIILSGFYTEDVPALTTKAEELGLSKVKEVTNNNWACIVLTAK
ncbi:MULTISPECIES: 50S ribosomal protein L11 methyltransferase [Prevotellaceae]|uniref:50S ribosomal protein L11 methyltransferase n=1 Tax=Prevotellaceae TaxID=171552 RepID=UPI0003D3566B|nr:50S ribosomal protein L11 methyltransferase [Prevotella phocaeensis]ETD21269.1 ribosomal protein L11 methyltransferase [Hoylesella oralis CC98A]